MYDCSPSYIGVPGAFGGQKNLSNPFGPAVTDGWVLSHECWELSPDPLRQQVFFNCWAISLAHCGFFHDGSPSSSPLFPLQVNSWMSYFQNLYCVCVCTNVNVLVVSMCMCDCVCVHADKRVDMEATGQHWMSFLIALHLFWFVFVFVLFFDTGFSLNLGLTTCQAGWSVGPGNPPVSFPSADVTGKHCLIWLRTWALGTELRSSCLHSKHLTLPHPCDLFL